MLTHYFSSLNVNGKMLGSLILVHKNLLQLSTFKEGLDFANIISLDVKGTQIHT